MTNQIRNQKDQLAKLMATEDLTIVHKKVPTAYFDMKNRILCCPILKDDISNELYDLFMGHEVGHALHTPYEGVHSALTKNKTLKGYLNVVEDVRIERKIREKYQGLRKSFYTAYNELMEIDFFGIAKMDLQELSLIDKINLITKVGSRVAIKLTPAEQEFLDMANACETWDEVVECATAIYEWSKENETRTEDDEKLVPQTLDLGEDEDEDEDYGDEDGEEDSNGWEDSDEDNLPDLEENEGDTDGQGEEQDIEEESEKQIKTTGKDGGEGETSDYDDEDGARESITEHSAHNNEEQFISEENVIVSLIDLKSKFDKNNNYSDMVVGYKTIIQDWEKDLWNKEDEPSDRYSSYNKERTAKMSLRAKRTAKNLTDKNSKLVNHMAKEFEMKQTAMQASKAMTGKTGKLDMNRLAKYQIVDDVFKKVTMIPDGQNHGVNVLLDWSGSIHGQVCDLLEQTLILVQFCRKAGIPHRVYLFSDCYRGASEYELRCEDKSVLLEIFSNEMSTKDYNQNLNNVSSMWNNYFASQGSYRGFEKFLVKWNAWFDGIDNHEIERWISLETGAVPQQYRLGGTPLDHSLVAMRTELVKFNKMYNVEKSILTIITDGISHQSPAFNKESNETKDQNEQETEMEKGTGDQYRWSRIRTIRKFQDPFSKKLYTYSDQSSYGRDGFVQTQNLLNWISKETGVVITGYFVFEKKRDLYSLPQSSLNLGDYDTAWKSIRKEGLAVKCHGWNKLFLTASSTLAVDGDDELDEKFIGAKKSSLMAAFKKNQRTKTTSRFLTNEFIKEIA
jgi:hypothetical protein